MGAIILNKRKKNILKVLLILLIVLIILSVIFVKYYKVEKVKEENKINEQLVANSVENYLSDKIAPQGMSKLYSKYTGDNDLNDVYRKIYLLVNYLPIICKLDNQSDIEYFYQNNKTEIENKIGISDKEKFVSFVNYVKDSGYNGEEFYTCKIDSSSFNTKNKYFTFILEISFEDFNDKLRLLTNIALKENVNPVVYFSIVE